MERFGVKDERLKDTVCPNCDAKLNDATNVGDDSLRPEPGDLSACIKCAAALTYQDDMTLRMLSADEFLELPDDVRLELADYSRAVHAAHEQSS